MNNMRRLLNILMLVSVMAMGSWGFVNAQTSDEIIQKVVASGRSMKSMKCTFTQTLTTPMLENPSVSKGRILYFSDSKLKIEYSVPVKYSISVKDGQVTISGKDGDNELGLIANRIAKGITTMMMGLMKGDELADRKAFTNKARQEDGKWVVDMTPRRVDLKRMFSKVVLIFDPKTSLLVSMEMFQEDGGSTLIAIDKVETGGNYESEW